MNKIIGKSDLEGWYFLIFVGGGGVNDYYRVKNVSKLL